MHPYVYQLDPSCFLATPGLVQSVAFKKTRVKLDLLTDTGMLLMVEKDVRGRICYDIYRHVKTDNKYMKNYDKNKESSYLRIGT